MSELIYRDVDFGLGHGGLADVHYRVVDDSGATVVARTNSGVFEHPDLEGGYGAKLAVPAGMAGTIIWDGDGGGLVARERIDLSREPTTTEIADTTLRRKMTNVRASAHGDTLDGVGSVYGMVQMQQFSGPVAGGELPVYHPDGVTLLGTLTVYVSASATPVIGTRGQ